MIYINNAILTGVVVEKVNGLYDFPKLKASEIDWDDQPLVEFDDSQKTWQFGVRKIRVNCYIQGDTYSAAMAKLNNIKTTINADGLIQLTIPNYSNRACLVRVDNQSMAVHTRYEPTNARLRFTLNFIEPQPFNIQFYYDISTPTSLSLTIGKISKSLSLASDLQRFFTVYHNGSKTEINAEQVNYEYNDTLTVGRHYFVVVGDIDQIDTINSSIVPSYRDVADYYFRNGSITT